MSVTGLQGAEVSSGDMGKTQIANEVIAVIDPDPSLPAQSRIRRISPLPLMAFPKDPAPSPLLTFPQRGGGCVSAPPLSSSSILPVCYDPAISKPKTRLINESTLIIGPPRADFV